MTTILEKFGLTPVNVVVPKGLDYIPQIPVRSEQVIGIEVEVENTGSIGRVPKGSPWTMITDGSLRNNGHEFITSPIPANYAPAVLNQLMTQILNQDCSFSPRTSVHVHLNMQDVEVGQAMDFVLLYSVFERLFYKFAGRGRIRNIFCVPITETSFLPGMSKNGVATAWSKYTGLNLSPLSTRGESTGYGTIEFRHMHGTFDVAKLSIWINFITMLKEYVLKTPTKTIRTMLLGMDDNFPFQQLLVDIFGDMAFHFRYSGVSEVAHCYHMAKSALFANVLGTRLLGPASRESAFYQFKG